MRSNILKHTKTTWKGESTNLDVRMRGERALIENQLVFSIIIPVYRTPENYLRKCIESVMAQTYREIEIILIDDNSPDNCGVICDRYAKQDDRIKVIHKKHEGVSVARNTGIAAARGTWIWFVDSDDWIEADSCERLLAYTFDKNIEVIMFQAWKNYASRQIKLTHNNISARVYDTERYSDRELLYRKVMQPLNMAKCPVSQNTFYYSCDKLFKRNFLHENQLTYVPGIPVSEDKIFVLNCFEKIHFLNFVDERLYHYRINNGSATMRYSDSIDADRRRAILVLKEMAIRLDEQLSLQSGIRTSILVHDLDMFTVSTVYGILLRKYFNNKYFGSYRKRKSDALLFMQSAPFASSIEGMKYRELSTKNAIRFWMVKNGHFRIFCFSEKLYRFLSGRIVRV